MKEVSPVLKSWVELIEKFLLIIYTSSIILTAAFKWADFLSSKTNQADAQKQEIIQRTAAIDLMIKWVMKYGKIPLVGKNYQL